MSAQGKPASGYQKLVQRTRPPAPKVRGAEDELDALIKIQQQRDEEDAAKAAAGAAAKADPIEVLRALVVNELVEAFVALQQKYAKIGITMEMDASGFMNGGREIKFAFSMRKHRMLLVGTVTSEAIAFHETRYAPDVAGELMSAPMLRLHGLDASGFREFICNRLSILLRSATQRR